MIGFITDPATAQAVLNGIKVAQETRGLPIFWSTGSHQIFTGEHAGEVFIPADESILTTNLRKGDTPMDFPETPQLIAALGGFGARVDLNQQALINPNAPEP